jgi:hypothetical protein
LAVRVLVVLIHLCTDLTTRALAALFHTSQSTVDPIIHHLAPVLARPLRPAADNSNSGQPWIIDSHPDPGSRPLDQRGARTTGAVSTPRSSSALTAAR